MNKMEINKMNKDIAELFYNFDFERFENDKVKKLLVNKDE